MSSTPETAMPVLWNQKEREVGRAALQLRARAPSAAVRRTTASALSKSPNLVSAAWRKCLRRFL